MYVLPERLTYKMASRISHYRHTVCTSLIECDVFAHVFLEYDTTNTTVFMCLFQYFLFSSYN